MDALALRLGVRSGALRLVGRLALLHFILIASYTLARASRDAVFLAKLTAQRLPYLYVAVALFTALVSFGLGRASGRQSLQRSLVSLMILSGVALVAFAALFHLDHGSVPPIAFYLWSGAYGLILVSLFWSLVNEATDPREAPRLFGLVGAGGILGGLVGGAIAGAAGGALGPEIMLVLAGGMLVAASPLALQILEPTASRSIPLALVREENRPLLGDSYVRLIAAMFLVGGITASLIDYQFKVVLQAATGGNRMQLTRWLGLYYTALNAGAIVLQLLASAWLLRRFGASNVSMLLPGGLVVGAAIALLKAPGLLLAASLRTFEAGMRVSLAKSAWEFLYFPLDARRRRRVKTLVDAVVDRFSEAVAGVLILTIVAILGTEMRPLLVCTLLGAAGWLALAVQLRAAYVRQLSMSLRSLVVDQPQPEGPPEAQLITEAHHLLASPFEKRALYAVDLLERIDADGLDRRLGELLDHPAPAVRARALRRLADPAHPIASPLLRTLLHDDSPEVRQAAIRLYAARYDDSASQMKKLLASQDSAARTAALLHLVSQPGTTDEPFVAERIEALLQEGDATDRAALALALATRPRPSTLHQFLLRMLDDADDDVRRATIAACGMVGLREFVPALVPLLAQSSAREPARSALSAFGNRIVGTLGDYLEDPSVVLTVRRELPRVLSRIGTQTAANELLRVAHAPDELLNLRLLQAQNSIRERDAKVHFPRRAVRTALQGEVELYLLLTAHAEVWRAEPPSRARDVLLTSLEERLTSTFARIFKRLELVYPPREIALGYRALSEASRRTRAQALEYLEATLLPEDRRLVMPLIEEPERRHLLAEAMYGIRPFTRATSLEALVRGSDPWLQACALYAIGAERWKDLLGLVQSALDAAAPIVRETAAWSLRRVETS
jgi:AAA family ATP:ADP antiporter